MPKEFMPNLQFPQLSVITNYENASSEEVENLVTKIIEENCGTVRGVKKIYSSSKEGVSLVTFEFDWGTDMNFASLNLREKIDLAKNNLPDDCEDPIIEKFNPFDMPVMIFSLSGSRSEENLLEIAKKTISETLDKIPGVAQVVLQGGREREIKVLLDRDKLSEHNISITNVVKTIENTNITFPIGVIKDTIYEYTVRVSGIFKNLFDIRTILVGIENNPNKNSEENQGDEYYQTQTKSIVMLQDLGQVVDGFKERKTYSRYNDKYNISISIIKQGDGSTVEIAKKCKKALDEINYRLPKDVKLDLIYDQSVYIKNSINDLIANAFFGGLLAFLVILVSLKNFKDAMIVSISIPVSVFIAFFCMYSLKIGINSISLAGIILGIGQLVDASIVVNENIARHRLNKNFVDAVIDGSTEVIGPVVGSFATTIVVFLPLIFAGGLIGQIFKDLSWSVIFCLTASLFVAFTLIPMLATLEFSKTKNANNSQNSPHQKVNPTNEKHTPNTENTQKTQNTEFIKNYKKLLFYFFKNYKKVILIFLILSALMAFVLVKYIPKELFPKANQPNFVINLTMPFGTKLDITNQIAKKIEHELKKLPQTKNYSTNVGSVSKNNIKLLGENESKIYVDLHEEYKKSVLDIQNKLKKKCNVIFLAGGEIKFSSELNNLEAVTQKKTIIKGYEKPFVIEFKGYDLNIMKHESANLMNQLKNIKGIKNISTSVSPDSRDISIKLNKEMLTTYNLNVDAVSDLVLSAVKGKVASKFREEGKEIDILVKLSDTENLKNLDNLLIDTPFGIKIPIYYVAEISYVNNPIEIFRIDKSRVVIVSADVYGINFDKLKEKITPALEKTQKRNKDISIELAGDIENIKSSNKNMKIILILSILFVYMIMAAEFESFWQPFVILFTIPMSLIGIVPGLLLTNCKLSVMAGMGIVLVCGMVVNNGIVLIDFVNQNSEKNLSLEENLINASLVRMRPIIMTAMTAILGLFPIILNISGDSYMQVPMAIVVVSGLGVSTFLTLLILPVIFFGYKKTFKV
jgi:HAE1 family hydrophobic/amphiphilic exporter-1